MSSYLTTGLWLSSVLVPRVRIGLTTRGSSGPCSTTELPRRMNHVDPTRFELVTSSMPWRRATSYAKGPLERYNILLKYRLQVKYFIYIYDNYITNIQFNNLHYILTNITLVKNISKLPKSLQKIPTYNFIQYYCVW